MLHDSHLFLLWIHCTTYTCIVCCHYSVFFLFILPQFCGVINGTVGGLHQPWLRAISFPSHTDLHLYIVDTYIYKSLPVILTLTFKALFGECPVYLADLIKVQQIRRTGLRSGDRKKLIERRCRRQWAGDRSFMAAAPRLWNALPLAPKESQSLQIFKKNLKSFLFEQSFM